ncbi:hypothetical protein BH11PLA1_BH11PLA1_03240 [soil metagenome]
MSTTRRLINKLLGTKTSAQAEAKSTTKRRTAAYLERAAGMGLAAEMEQLEQRQMLFTLQVQTTNPTFVADPAHPGYGTVTATFGYFIPFLSAVIPNPAAPTYVAESFDAIPPAPGAPPAPLPAFPNVFQGSLLTVFDRSAGATAIITVPPPATTPPTTGTSNYLAITIPAGGFIELAFFDPNGDSTFQTINGVEFITYNGFGSTLASLRVDGRALNPTLNPPAAPSLPITDAVGLPNLTRLVDQTGAQPGVINNFAFEFGMEITRFTNTSGAAQTYRIDNFAGILPTQRFNTVTEDRIFGAQLSLYGRPETAPGANDGTALQVVDLYGRDLIATIALGRTDTSRNPLFDRNGDGVPDGIDTDGNGTFESGNDGIGRINLIRGDARAGFNVTGGTIAFDAVLGFQFTIASASLVDDFRDGGFALEGSFVNGTWQFRGFEDANATVIIGSPWARDNRNADTYFGGNPNPNNPALRGTDNTAGIPITRIPTDFANEVRVFGAVNRPLGNPAGDFVRYAYNNAGNYYGLTQTVIENTLGRVHQARNRVVNNVIVPALANAPVIPAPALSPPTVPNPVLEQGIHFDGALLPANRVWGQFVIEGILFGAARFDGSLSRVVITTPAANIIVNGDLGLLIVNGDLGGARLLPPNSVAPADSYRIFPSQITVGRALGQLLVSGRIIGTPVTVLGAVNDPNRATTDFLNYNEIERVIFIDPATTGEAAARIIQASARALDGSAVTLFGGDASTGAIYRNDLLPGAEFVGTGLRGVIINGTLGQRNTQFNAEDRSDIYAFAATAGGTMSIAIQYSPAGTQTTQNGVYARVVDRNGRVVSSAPFPFLSPNSAIPTGGFNSTRFSFTPESSEIYYLVLTVAPDNQNNTQVGYVATLQGQAQVTTGLISTGGGTTGNGMPVFIQNGSLGLLRVGNGIIDPSGAVTQLGDHQATVETPADYLSVNNIALAVAGDVYGIILGNDLRGGSLNIGGNLGSFSTGRFFSTDNAGIDNIGFLGGNVYTSSLSVGGAAGTIDISGSVGFNNNPSPQVGTPRPGEFTLITGANSVALNQPGNVGNLLVGGFINGQDFTFQTSANSIIDRFEIGGRSNGALVGSGQIALGNPNFQFGPGTDIRFFDFAGLTSATPGSLPDADNAVQLDYGVPFQVTDDSGSVFSILISGGLAANGANQSVGQLFLLPIGNARVVGGLGVNLFGNADLSITNMSGTGRAALGTITVSSASVGAVRSNIIIGGTSEIDIRNLQAPGLFGLIRNSTPGGDIVSLDVGGVNQVVVERGSLGQGGNAAGGSNRGTFLGLTTNGLQAGIGAPLGFAPGVLNGVGQGNQNGGGIFVPISPPDNTQTLEDIGAPFDGYLNGVVIRTGNVQLVQARDYLGDIILQSGGIITSVVANPNNIVGDGVYRGISGSIYAGTILNVDIGDGIMGPGDSPFAAAGIFAENDIGNVTGGFRVRNPVVNGIISAANNIPTPVVGGAALNGIGLIQIFGGTVDNAYISVSNLDAFFRSARNTQVGGLQQGDPNLGRGTVHNLRITNTNFSRSTIFASSIGTVLITNGAWDGSIAQAAGGGAGGVDPQSGLTPGSIRSISATTFMNSTMDGAPGEFRISSITAAANLTTLSATGLQGDINDLNLTVGGNVVGSITARNIQRSRLAISGSTSLILTRGDILGSSISTGAFTSLLVLGSLRQSSLDSAGLINSIYVTGDIENVTISSTGGAGGLNVLIARSFTGTINSSGTVGTVNITGGDFTGVINTTGPTSNITYLRASRDLNVSLSVGGNVGTLSAGRNIGRRIVDATGLNPLTSTPDVIDIRGNLTSVLAGGQIYSDLIVGQSIIGIVQIGYLQRSYAVGGLIGGDNVSDATISAFGRIAAVSVSGDFGGRIISYSGGIGSIVISLGSLRAAHDGDGVVVPAIDVRDGDLGALVISSGSLYGGVKVRDGSINAISVIGDAIFGNIGIDPTLSLTSTIGTLAAQFRTQLPPNSTDPLTASGNGTQDGPMIFAGRDIFSIVVTGGIFESGIMAGRTLGAVSVSRGVDATGLPSVATGTTTPSFFIAGDQINSISIARRAAGTLIGSGITGLGADNRPGGVGINADTVRQGNITSVGLLGSSNNVTIVAGMNAGADGIYTQGGDDTAAAGLSTIININALGTVTNVRAFADTNIVSATAAVVRGGGVFTGSTYIPAVLSDPRIAPGIPGAGFTLIAPNVLTAFTTAAGETGNFRLIGPGQVYFNDATDRLVLVGTTAGSSLIFSNTGAFDTLSGITINSTDDASLAALTFNSRLAGTSGIFIDGTIGSFTARTIDITQGATFGSGIIGAGGGITAFTVTDLATKTYLASGPTPASGSGFLRGILQTGGSDGTVAGLRADGDINSIYIGSNFGTGAGVDNRRIQARGISSLVIGGNLGGVVSVDRDLLYATITGAANGGSVRAGGRITAFSAASTNGFRISGGGGIASINVNGDATDSQFVGSDLGRDGLFGGTGVNADLARSGSIGPVTVRGNFIRSDIAAGSLRGSDGFFGTGDDAFSSGRANVGAVNIFGTSVGSPNNGQSFRVTGTGTVQSLRVGNTAVTGIGNFQTVQNRTIASQLQVSDFRIQQVGGIYQAIFTFNQPIAGAQSLLSALTIQEVRGTLDNRTLGPVLTGGLAGSIGNDFTVSYDPLSNTAILTFSTAITTRDLATNAIGPDTLGALPGPGTYVFTIDSTGANRLRAATSDGTLDGDNNGTSGDAFVRTDILGDAGDRLTPFTAATGTLHLISLYSPANLDFMLSQQGVNSLATGLNHAVTIRGTIGDHPDFDPNGFGIGSDTDLYNITLTAGQVLSFGATSGAASGVERILLIGNQRATTSGDVTQRPDGTFYVNTTGVYTIMVTTTATADQLVPEPPSPFTPPIVDTGTLVDSPAAATQIGAYAFTVTIIDDGNSGFRDLGVNPALGPVGTAIPADFNANRSDVVLQASIAPGTFYAYRYVQGTDGILDNRDDTIIGQLRQIATGDFLGVLSIRTAGVDGLLGNADDVVRLVNAAGAGADIVTAPLPSAFLGTAATFNQPGNLPFINVGNYVFRLDPGVNGRFDGNGTNALRSDDVVIGTDFYGNTIERRAGADGVFSNVVAAGALSGNNDITTVRSAISTANQPGVPTTLASDVDIYNLNNGLPIQPGSRYRITLRANDAGSNFGRLFPQQVDFAGVRGFQIVDIRGQVQFGIFDTTGSIGLSDGGLVAAPSNVQLFGGATPNTTLASNGITRYGYDARGDFYIEFAAPPRQGPAAPDVTNFADWASLSLYVQGAVRSNYGIEIQQLSTAAQTPSPAVNTQVMTQNILIDTRGGTVNWLESGGRPTTLAAYNVLDNGFAGVYNGVSALDYILTTNAAINPNSLILQLQNAYNGLAGFTPGGQPLVRISSNPADFEGQAYSTVFLSGSQQPGAFFGDGEFGAVQRVDAFNANSSDQSVVFMPSLNVLGNFSSQTGLNAFINQLTNLVGRQTGQLLGLRTEVPIDLVNETTPFSIMGSRTPTDVGAGNTYGFTVNNRPLAGTGTDFFLGNQNAASLLQRIFYAQ